MSEEKKDHTHVRIALDAIGGAIRYLREPTGTIIEFGVFGSSWSDTYSTATEEQRLVVTEDLIGAAFVISQTWINATKKQGKGGLSAVEHVANYWKHRDTWGEEWGPENNPMARKTIDAVKKLGATPPVKPGQLSSLAKAVLDKPFSVGALWDAIQ